MKKNALFMIVFALLFAQTGCAAPTSTRTPSPPLTLTQPMYLDATLTTSERVADLLGRMSLEEKAAQMVQGERGTVSNDDLKKYGLGSVLGGGGSVPGSGSLADWEQLMRGYQKAVLSRELKIPLLYGIDAVHGHSNVKGAVVFPHNIGLGAANDPVLVKEMGKMVADEMKLTKILWNFSPCVAIASDPRWGRTYESYSTDPHIVTALGNAYFEGQKESGVIATAKHYVADGGVKFGTGSGGNLIDRGDAQLSDEVLREIYLKPYTELVKNGVPVVMASFSSLNGEPMHSHHYLLTEVLKKELGFEGFVVSDWEAVHLLDAGKDFNDQVQLSINAGIDMLMEPNDWKKTIDAIAANVKNGNISEERLNDAVSRILTVKFDSGIFEDPYLANAGVKATELGSANYRQLAAELVSKSLVLLKNDKSVLPFKKGQKIFVLGPGADDIGLQCGGWTIQWQGASDGNGPKLTAGTTILEGLQNLGEQMDVAFITDESKISEADVILLALSEIPYAEMKGDTADLSIVGAMVSPENQGAIQFAQKQNKPIVTLILAGRNVLIDEFIGDWDSVVMCFLPGSEGQGVADVLLGKKDFTGRLPMPWYKKVEDIGDEQADLLYPQGYSSK